MYSLPGFQRIPVLLFGRRQPFTYDLPADQAFALTFGDDARLFLTTFLGGLMFMSVYLA